MLRFRRHPISAGHLSDLNTVARGGIIDYEFLQSEPYAGTDLCFSISSFGSDGLSYELHDVIQRNGRFRRVDNCFELGLKTHRKLLTTQHRNR